MRHIHLKPELFRPVCLALILWVGAVGCQRLAGKDQPEPPDYLKVSTVELAPADEESALNAYRDALKGNIQAEASIPYDPQITEPAQRVLMARAEAKRAVLRQLAKNILAVNDKDNNALSVELKTMPEKQSELAGFIESQVAVTFQETGQGSKAKAAIEGGRVMDVLARPTASELARRAKPDPQKLAHRKERSYDLALESVKKKLKDQLLNIKLSETTTLGDRLNEDAAAMRKLDAQIFVATPDEVQYQDDGSCKVTLFFDRNQARAMAESRHGWFRWRH